MHPRCVITINGAPVAGAFWERLLKVTVTDREGARADTIDLDLEDGPPHIAIPQDSDLIQCWLGYEETGIAYMGAFKVADVDLELIVGKMRVRGESADMTAPLKEHKERHWDDKSVEDIVNDVAKDAGLTAQIDPEIGGHTYKYWLQQNASGMHMLDDLLARHNGLWQVKDGKLLAYKRGAGTTPGGAALPPLILTRPQIVGSPKVSFQKRSKHKDVSGEYYDRDEAKLQRETEPGEDKTEAKFTLRHGYADKGEAKRAAKSKSKYLQREGVNTTVDIEGDPNAKAGRPMSYAGVRPGVDGIVFTIEEAAHHFAKQGGYHTDLKAKLKVD